jgi:hypothetical protein
MTVPELTLAVQADEFRSIRARAIASGSTPDIPEAPRNVLSNLLRGRIEDTAGWALLNQDKADEAVAHFKRAVTILPEGTPAARTALWHLGVALERQDKKSEALSSYIRSYNSGDPDPVRRALIEQLYRKVNGSLEGLDERVGPAPAGAVEGQTAAANNPTETTSDKTGESSPAAAPSPSVTPVAEASPVPADAVPSSSPSPSTEVPAATPEETPATEAPSPTLDPAASASPEPTPEAVPTPSPEAPAAASATPTPASSPSLETSPVGTMNKPVRATVAITGRVKDSNGNGIANVVVVLISPQGTVLASTTDEKGNYSFTVATAAAARSYRIIPSKDGFAFDPIDRILAVLSDDLGELDFVERPNPKP